MGIMRCDCGRIIDLDTHLEDWDEELECCWKCKEYKEAANQVMHTGSKEDMAKFLEVRKGIVKCIE